MGHGEELRDGGQDLRRDGYLPRRSWPGDADPWRHRHRQHHAGGGQRAHARDRLAQGAGRYQPQHPVAVLSGRRLPDAFKRGHRDGWRCAANVPDERHGKGAGLRSAHHVVHASVPIATVADMYDMVGFDPPTMSYMSATVAIGTLALAGIFAGLYPARKASILQPVDALRQE